LNARGRRRVEEVEDEDAMEEEKEEQDDDEEEEEEEEEDEEEGGGGRREEEIKSNHKMFHSLPKADLELGLEALRRDLLQHAGARAERHELVVPPHVRHHREQLVRRVRHYRAAGPDTLRQLVRVV
jgi:hypothetical protein